MLGERVGKKLKAAEALPVVRGRGSKAAEVLPILMGREGNAAEALPMLRSSSLGPACTILQPVLPFIIANTSD